MNPERHQHDICLEHNTPVRIPSPRGMRVTCTAGVLWLTVESESGDLFLTPGRSHLIRARGLALVEAIGYARARFERSGTSTAPGRQRSINTLLRSLAAGWRVCRNTLGASRTFWRRAATG